MFMYKYPEPQNKVDLPGFRSLNFTNWFDEIGTKVRLKDGLNKLNSILIKLKLV
jgi:hypothetical protein